ncbi:MAG TPA: hypothetical protein PK040_07160 [Anaerolineaceae bacterium]|nr:hypothetical protein [Anaerolineaceae bacterium]
MKSDSGLAKFLRFFGILLMSLTAAFTVMGGIGTSCAALFPTKWESMAPLAKMQWLYILFVLVTTAIGILMIRAIVRLVRGKADGYKSALITLVLGIVVGIIHILTSRSLRGSSMPVDAVVYMTVLTLVVFLLFRLPPVWKGVDYSKAPRKERRKTGGTAAIVTGAASLSIQFVMASTHTWNGVNFADAFHTAMTVSGIALLVLGTWLVSGLRVSVQKETESLPELS